MSLALLVVAVVATVNPARARGALPGVETRLVGALGAAVTWVALVPVVAVADGVLDAVEVAASTLRMAVGLVLVLQGGWAVLSGSPPAEPALPGRRAALVPVAFPVLLTPGLGLLAVSGALDRSALASLVVLAAALATVPAVASVDASAVHGRVLDGVGRVTAAVLVVSGVALVLDGIFDI